MQLRTALLAAALITGPAGLAKAVTPADTILPPTVIFATSTGYWEESRPDIAIERAPGAASDPAKAEPQPRRGYYKLFSVRQPDKTSKIYLQQIAQTDSGPEIVSSVELHEFTQLKPYVTDIRPESSTGMGKQPGLFATVYLKTDPNAESEGWTVLIDEFGEITIEKATN
ncbi:hypothetical protein AB3480_00825 [Rhizobium mongolense]|uniref:hypothetical protein n=1 Tax=Rhizobium mongolense TaxID=57676 RepID=UPI0034A17921